ncbi:MAG: AMP-binding protein, partial [Acidimicrobiaceae bacterium]|nr:AMP-binding protein [Acidimicrobiaceae bacterium]
MRSIADIPRRQAAENPDKPALICHDRTLTYRDLDAESSQVANALIAAGVGSQSRVGFIG